MSKLHSLQIIPALVPLLSSVHAYWHGAWLLLSCPVFFPRCCLLVFEDAFINYLGYK